MAAITAIINPTGQLPMVFFLNEASHCDLHLDKGAFGATDMIPIGPVKKLSAFASIMHENLISVYGIVHHPAKEGESEDLKKNCTVSLVSPIIRPTPCITRSGCIAATSHTDKHGHQSSWLYYLRIDNTIMEYVNGGPNPASPLMPTGTLPSELTYLAAFCDTKGYRHVFYQLEDGNIMVYNQDDKSNVIVVDSQDTVAKTPMAVCMVMKGGIGTAYLYFSSPAPSYKLRRVHSTENRGWDTPKTINLGLGNYTQLSAIGDDTTREIMIYFHVGRVLNCYTDEIDKV